MHCGQADWIHDAHFQNCHGARYPWFFDVHEKAELLDVPTEELEELLATARSPAGTSSVNHARTFASIPFTLFAWTNLLCLAGIVLNPCFPARTRLPAFESFLRACAPEYNILADSVGLVSTSHFRCGLLSLLVLLPVFFMTVFTTLTKFSIRLVLEDTVVKDFIKYMITDAFQDEIELPNTNTLTLIRQFHSRLSWENLRILRVFFSALNARIQDSTSLL